MDTEPLLRGLQDRRFDAYTPRAALLDEGGSAVTDLLGREGRGAPGRNSPRKGDCPMSYRPCPSCGQQNRSEDANCWSCQGDLAAEPAPEPLPAAAPSLGSGPAPADRSSTWLHGLRSGAAAGAVFGVLFGMMGSMFGALITSGFTNRLETAGMVGALIFLVVLVEKVIFGSLLGTVLGALGELCYQIDAARVGAWFGAAWAVLSWLFLGGSFMGIVFSAGYGAAVGWLASYIEKRVFRRQYAEL